MRNLVFTSALVSLSVAFIAACGSGGSGGGGSGGMSSSSSSSSASSSTSTSSSGSSSSSSGLPAGACRAPADCDQGDFCSLNVLPTYCGGCDTAPGGDCQSDADCADAGAGVICDKPCVCWLGGAIPSDRCTKGCAGDADCGPSLTCNATHRCEARACAAPADCTANFACTAGNCAPKLCTKDADCGDHCVNGACAPILGTCSPAVP